MRTSTQIKNNAQSIYNLMGSLREQVSLLENEYQANAVKATGNRIEDWDKDIANLKAAIASLNSLAHMEDDFAQDIKAAKEMLEEGMDPEEIAMEIGISVDAVEELKASK